MVLTLVSSYAPQVFAADEGSAPADKKEVKKEATGHKKGHKKCCKKGEKKCEEKSDKDAAAGTEAK